MVARLAATTNPEEDDMFQEPPEHWRIDRRIPLALIGALLVQTFSIVWWAARISDRVETLEAQAALSSQNGERMARLEEKMNALKETVQRIEAKLERR